MSDISSSMSDIPASLKQLLTKLSKEKVASKEQEVEILKGMLAQKDEEIDRLKDKLRIRDLKADILRADIESAWENFDTSQTIRSPKIRSNKEIKHGKEPREETKGMAPKQDGLKFSNMISLPLLPAPSPFPTFTGSPCPSYLSTAESNIVGATMSTELHGK
ncbi:unnamed protein product [Dovyalis caffra]|uniref:Uncharacterized protein n=1 Tax=Dovyalis caffra TaxID=77055 RepID=A0AAV1S6G9_9ROSI|nr:unnamed protein product [Dovyalis caffra]